jgi:5-formyltetrahydrofolate cyclo-ligase
VAQDAPKPNPKDGARAVAKQRRATLDLPVVASQVCAHLVEFLAPGPEQMVLSYLAMPGEIDLHAAHGQWPGAVAVTRTPEVGGLTIHQLTNDLETHRYGFDQPTASAPEIAVHQIAAVLVPGLAFSHSGDRLGWGKGHYDTMFAAMAAANALPPMRIGVTSDTLVVGQLPTAAHDVAMTHLVTESGVRPARPGN